MFIYFYFCKYYSHEWLNEDSKRLAPHQDHEITRERKNMFNEVLS